MTYSVKMFLILNENLLMTRALKNVAISQNVVISVVLDFFQ